MKELPELPFRKAVKDIIANNNFNYRRVYRRKIIPQLVEKFEYTAFEIPKILKISINYGIAKIAKNPKELEILQRKLAVLIGQQPRMTKAKNSIAAFNIREGMDVGLAATLRRNKMYTFLYKLIHPIFPLILDFRGIRRGNFDGTGNFNFGLSHVIFPEFCYPAYEISFEISIVTTARTDRECCFLLKSFGFPIVIN